jgi:energy-coupling factor transport system ATP-binding protein
MAVSGLDSFAQQHPLGEVPIIINAPVNEKQSTPAVELQDVWFRYNKDAPDVVRGLSMKVFPASFMLFWAATALEKPPAFIADLGINQPYRGT